MRPKIQVSNLEDVSSRRQPRLRFDLTLVFPINAREEAITLRGCLAVPNKDCTAGWQWNGPLSWASSSKTYQNHQMTEGFQNIVLTLLQQTGKLEYMRNKYPDWWLAKSEILDGPGAGIIL